MCKITAKVCAITYSWNNKVPYMQLLCSPLCLSLYYDYGIHGYGTQKWLTSYVTHQWVMRLTLNIFSNKLNNVCNLFCSIHLPFLLHHDWSITSCFKQDFHYQQKKYYIKLSSVFEKFSCSWPSWRVEPWKPDYYSKIKNSTNWTFLSFIVIFSKNSACLEQVTVQAMGMAAFTRE